MKEFLTNLPLKYKIIMLAIMLIVIVVVFVLLYKYYYTEDENIYNENEIEEVNNEKNLSEGENEDVFNNNQSTSSQNSKIGKAKTEKTIIVHVIGEVQTPGVVELEEGARIIDAIEKAGGKTEEADLSKINLAYIIEDGVQIYVPRIGDDLENTIHISEDAGIGIITQNSKQEDNKTTKVNINTASIEKLQTLPRNWRNNSTKNNRL